MTMKSKSMMAWLDFASYPKNQEDVTFFPGAAGPPRCTPHSVCMHHLSLITGCSACKINQEQAEQPKVQLVVGSSQRSAIPVRIHSIRFLSHQNSLLAA